jgi:hypothetical protein
MQTEPTQVYRLADLKNGFLPYENFSPKSKAEFELFHPSVEKAMKKR